MTHKANPEETFCIDDLMQELHTYTAQRLQCKGKSNVEIEVFNLSNVDKCLIKTDCNRLRQIFISLIDNAIKYTDTGYILFGYHVSNAPNYMNFFVDDTGTGIINDADLDIAIAQGLVKLMGGKMEVRPSNDAGISVNFGITCERFEADT